MLNIYISTNEQVTLGICAFLFLPRWSTRTKPTSRTYIRIEAHTHTYGKSGNQHDIFLRVPMGKFCFRKHFAYAVLRWKMFNKTFYLVPFRSSHIAAYSVCMWARTCPCVLFERFATPVCRPHQPPLIHQYERHKKARPRERKKKR